MSSKKQSSGARLSLPLQGKVARPKAVTDEAVLAEILFASHVSPGAKRLISLASLDSFP